MRNTIGGWEFNTIFTAENGNSMTVYQNGVSPATALLDPNCQSAELRRQWRRLPMLGELADGHRLQQQPASERRSRRQLQLWPEWTEHRESECVYVDRIRASAASAMRAVESAKDRITSTPTSVSTRTGTSRRGSTCASAWTSSMPSTMPTSTPTPCRASATSLASSTTAAACTAVRRTPAGSINLAAHQQRHQRLRQHQCCRQWRKRRLWNRERHQERSRTPVRLEANLLTSAAFRRSSNSSAGPAVPGPAVFCGRPLREPDLAESSPARCDVCC